MPFSSKLYLTYSSDTSDEFGPQAGLGSLSTDFTLLSCAPLEDDLRIDFVLLFSILLLTGCLEQYLLLNLKANNLVYYELILFDNSKFF